MINDERYSKEEVKRLLVNYNFINELEAFNQDAMPICYKMDIDRALTATILKPEHLKVIALHFTGNLSLMQIQQYEGTSIIDNIKYIDEALNILTAVLNGELETTYHKKQQQKPETFQRYINHVASFSWHPCIMTDKISAAILELIKENDDLAKEALKQRAEGKPVIHHAEPNEYPFYEESHFINQAQKNNVIYSGFEHYASNQIHTGYKKAIVNADSKRLRKSVRK